jgi:hypothetical protein
VVVVILCDPQLDLLKGLVNKAATTPTNKVSTTKPSTKEPSSLQTNGAAKAPTPKTKPFHGGYVDFMPTPNEIEAQTLPPHPHGSMLADLCYYFEHHSERLEEAEWRDPATSSIFLQKIVAAHYLQLIDYIKAMLPSLESRLTTAWVKEQEQWKNLQIISRRCGNYHDDVEDTLLSLGHPIEGIQFKRRPDWKDCSADFQYIYFRLNILKQRADTLMSSMTGLASIAGNRQNLEEAKRVKRLNLLALLFIPLAYTSALFSMQDDYAPGRGKFWHYWASALGAVAVTLVATWVLDRSLNDAAQWSLKGLKFWDDDESKHPSVSHLKKTKTGLFD